MSSEMNRRGFIKGAGVFAVVVFCTALVASAEIATSKSQIKSLILAGDSPPNFSRGQSPLFSYEPPQRARRLRRPYPALSASSISSSR